MASKSSIEIEVKGLSDLPQAAAQVITYAGNEPIWIFDGEMGAGKTTLIQEICKQLGVVDVVSSPTFSIVNEYVNDENEVFYHFDCYRIRDEVEAMDIGVEEYLDSGYCCMIEWASKIANLLPENFYHIYIETTDKDSRMIQVKHV